MQSGTVYKKIRGYCWIGFLDISDFLFCSIDFFKIEIYYKTEFFNVLLKKLRVFTEGN